MDIYQESKWLALEKALLDDETGGPVVLPFLFLEAITQNFSQKQQIGRGGFGAVYKGQLPNGMVVAVKKLHNRIEILEENFQSEVACLIEAKHKNIVRFLGYCYETQHTRKQFEGRFVWADERQMLFCFEYLSKGNLSDHLTEPSTGLQWKVRYQIIKGICEGVNYLHQQRIIHMDLKPQNILLDDSMVPKIVDFGLSRRLSESQSRTITEHIVGTPGYMAPEFLRSQTVTFKTDIYSLGVIIIEILMGYKEYSNVDKVLRSWTNTSVKSDPRLLEQVKVCADIGINCMDDNPGNRPAIEDIIHILDETDLSISSRDSSRFVPQPANRSLWRFHGKVLKNVNAGLWMNRLASLYFSVTSVGSTSSAGQLVDEPESTTVFSALSQLEEPESMTVFSASSQRAFDRFYQHYRLAKKACKPMRISAYTAPKETTTELGRFYQYYRQAKQACKPMRIIASMAPELRPCWSSESALLDVHPLELCFPFEAKKVTQCSLNLVNRTHQYFACFIRQQFQDMYAIDQRISYDLRPMSTVVLTVKMVRQETPPLDAGMFEILMISMESKKDLQNLESSIDNDSPKNDDDLLKRVEELDGEVHAAVLKAVICPPKDPAPKVISRFGFGEEIRTMDVHSTQPWILVGRGNLLSLWYCEMEVTTANALATSVRFIPRTEWCVSGDSRGYIHVYTCPTMDEIKSFKATGLGRVQWLAIHPTCPYLLSLSVSACQDTIEIWDWEKGWACCRKVHVHGITHATFNPMDANTFVTSHHFHGVIKVWSINPSVDQPITTIRCPGIWHHDHVFTEAAGPNHVVVSGLNRDPQIWDLETGTRVHTFSYDPGFSRCTAVTCHPTLPLIAAIGFDDDAHPAVCFWNSTNYRLVKTVWCTFSEMIRYLGFVGSRRLVIGTNRRIEVLEIDMESVACHQ